MAPEVFYAENFVTYDPFAADIWSLACILWPMLTGKALFRRPTTKDPRFLYLISGRIAELIQVDGARDNISAEAEHLLASMLKVNPQERATIAQIIAHPWLRDQQPQSQSHTSTSIASSVGPGVATTADPGHLAPVTVPQAEAVAMSQ